MCHRGAVVWGVAAALLLLAPAPRAAEPAKPRLDASGDLLPDGAIARIGTTRLRHAGSVENVAFAPDGKSLASGGRDGFLCLWETATGKLIRRFKVSEDRILDLAFSPDGKTLLSSDGSNTPCLWDAATSKRRLVLTGHTRWVHAVAFSPDGKTVATKSYEGTRLWDAATGKQLHTFPGSIPADYTNLAYSRDGKGIALISGGSLALFDTASYKEVQRFRGHNSGVSSLDVSPDGKMVATLGNDIDTEAVVRLWDVATAKEVRQFGGHGGIASPVRFSPDGKTVATGGVDKVVRRWNAATGKELPRCTGHSAFVSAVAFSPDGKVLASASADQTVKLWDTSTGKELPQSAGPDPVDCAALSADGKLLVTTGVGEDGFRLWDSATGKPLAHTGLELAGPVRALALSADGKLTAAGNAKGDLALWETAGGKKRYVLDGASQAPENVISYLGTLSFAPDGKSLVVVRPETCGSLELRDTATGKLLHPVRPGDSNDPASRINWSPSTIHFTPDGAGCVRSHLNVGMEVLDAATGKVRRCLPLPEGERDFDGLALSPDGRTIATGSRGAVRLWEMATGEERRRLDLDDKRVSAVAISPDGRLLAAGGTGKVVRVWQVSSGRELRTYAGHEGPVTALAFAAGGKLLSVSEDGTALIWDTSGLKPGSKRRPGKLDADADAVWAGLADADAAKAYELIGLLSESPEAATSLLRERLKPVDVADGRRINRLVAQLNDDDFDKREQASRELEKLSTQAAGALRKAVKAAASAEVVRRAGDLLHKLEGGAVSGEGLREGRALEVLEGLGTPEAKKLLEDLAKGAADAALTREAKASLERMKLTEKTQISK